MTAVLVRNKYLPLLFRWILGGVFILAGVPKIINPAEFAGSIANYQVLPREYIHLVAITLPWIEVVSGVMLIMGLWARANALLISGMMAMFCVLIASAIARDLNIECGCFGTVAGRRVGLISLGTDLVLLAMGIWLTWKLRGATPVASAAPIAPDPVPAG